MSICQIQHTLSPVNRQKLIEYHEKIDRTVVYYPTGERDFIDPLLEAMAGVVRYRISNSMLDYNGYKLETLILAKLGVGGRHPLHGDNCTFRDGKWVPNHTPNRKMTSVFYLNDDFEGGEIVFPQHNLIIKPEPGLLLIYPSDEHHIHEVLRVNKGTRYTVAIWFVYK